MAVAKIRVEISEETLREWVEGFHEIPYDWWENFNTSKLEAFIQGDGFIQANGDEGKVYLFNLSDLITGLESLSSGVLEGKNPPPEISRKTVERLLNGQWDVNDLDILLQAAIFDEIIYG